MEQGKVQNRRPKPEHEIRKVNHRVAEQRWKRNCRKMFSLKVRQRNEIQSMTEMGYRLKVTGESSLRD